MIHPGQPVSRSEQKGAVLVVSLMILVILTLVGVTAMATSSLEAVMAGNTQLQTRALANAENTLLTAEAAVDNITTTAGAFDWSQTDGYYLFDTTNPANNINPLLETWAFTSQAGPTSDERYVVEYVGNREIPGESIVVNSGTQTAGSYVYVFRITARSAEANSGALRLVQGIYVSNEAP